MIGSAVRYYSWVDIQDRLISQLPEHPLPEGVKLEVYGIGLYIYHTAAVAREAVEEILREIFPNSVNKEGLELESIDTNRKRYLPVYFQQVDEEEELVGPPFQPSFARPSVFSSRLPQSLLDRSENRDPVMIATHSFKGGVGRTLHAIVMAMSLEEQSPKPVLLIDADFEAPGITWTLSDPEISFADFLNLVHSERDTEQAIKLAARELRNQKQGNIYVMPAFRTDEQLRSLEIKPEHIFRFADNPFILRDFVAKLASELDAAYVILDLRAGISELSSSWLLDPRVAKVFVTTLSSQSVEGTITILELLSQFEKKFQLFPSDHPALILSQIDPDRLDEVSQIWRSHNGESYSTQGNNVAKLRDAMRAYLTNGAEIENREEIEMESPLVVSQLYSELRILPNDWQQIRTAIVRTGIQENVQELLATYLSTPNPQLQEINLPEARSKLYEIAQSLVYAESGEVNDFYKSPAIRALAKKNQTRLPNLVAIGAKGSGKTFLFKQINQAGDWKAFCEKAVGVHNETHQARIVPVTYPANATSNPALKKWIQQIKPSLDRGIAEAWPTYQWREHWLDVLAWSDNFQLGKNQVFSRYLEHLEQQGERVVFTFDGLEDLFPKYFDQEAQKSALRSLVQDVVQFIGVTPNSPLGMIIFIRGDITEHILPQNAGQFRDLYRDYALRWDRTEALRLVAWVMAFYEIATLHLDLEDIPNRSYEQLTEDLQILWGRKLGSDRSREALSAKYVLNSLSNFKEEIQSRDLMVFLRESIDLELKSTANSPDDRILSPSSIRKSIPPVSRNKVHEVQEENKNNRFGEALSKLEEIANQLQVPFETTDLLSAGEIQVLIDNGVLRLDKGKYYMAEIFRTGLNIRQGKGKARTDFGSAH